MVKKILISILLISLIMFYMNVPNVYAGIIGDALSRGLTFTVRGSAGKIDETKLMLTANDINNALLIISFVVVTIVGIILGIKYMMAGVEEKADVKKSLIIFVIGTVIAYGAFAIWKVLVDFLQTTGLG